MKIGVYIAGRNCRKGALAQMCLSSVESQTFKHWAAAAVDDASTDHTADVIFDYCNDDGYEITALFEQEQQYSVKNKLRAIDYLIDKKGAEILVGLDLDDALLHDALQVIHDAHEAGAWVTYGNWEDQDGAVNKHVPLPARSMENIRTAPWFLTAPNSFRAEIFRNIPHSFFRWDDDHDYYSNGFDGSVMFGAVDLAGPDRVTGIEQPIYIYNRNRDDCVLRSIHPALREATFAEQRKKPRLARMESLCAAVC